MVSYSHNKVSGAPPVKQTNMPVPPQAHRTGSIPRGAPITLFRLNPLLRGLDIRCLREILDDLDYSCHITIQMTCHQQSKTTKPFSANQLILKRIEYQRTCVRSLAIRVREFGGFFSRPKVGIFKPNLKQAYEIKL